MSIEPFIFPEDWGALANGGDDWNALQSAINAAAPWQEVYFSQKYGCSQPLTVVGKGIRSSGSATITAVGAAAAVGGSVDCFVFPPQFGHRKLVQPQITAFTGNSINNSAGVMDIECHHISNFGTGVLLGGGAIDCKISVHWFTTGTSCLKVSNATASTPIQGNTVSSLFATTCKYGLNYDGSPACDSNSLTFAAWDCNLIPGSAAFYNSSGSPLSNWRLLVTDWCGGFPASPAQAWVANGAFQFCTFECSNVATWPDKWSLFNITVGGGNTFKAACATGFAGSFVANWQIQPNNRTGFGVAGGAVYMNTRLCQGKTANIAAGATMTTYVYSPFTDGNSFSYRITPTVNPGFVLFALKDNSATTPNELAVTWLAMKAIPAYSEFDFQFTAGL
jgi:hypothetical protein